MSCRQRMVVENFQCLGWLGASGSAKVSNMNPKTKRSLWRHSPSFIGAIGFLIYAMFFELPISIVILVAVYFVFLVCRVFLLPE